MKKKPFQKIFILLFWLLVWQLLSLFVGNRILLVGPAETFQAFCAQVITLSFWKAVLFSFGRIGAGFFLAFVFGLLTAALCAKLSWLEDLLSPAVQFMKSIPVASFVILALIWTGSENLSVFISFLVVFPLIYTNVLTGLKNTDEKLLEMAQVFRVPFWKRALYLYRPALYPYLQSACKNAIGMGLKSGIAAEVIGVPAGSVGEGLYNAKIYLSTAELFSWTFTIIMISALLEHFFLFLLKKCCIRESQKHRLPL